jgi:hypothetical protein
MDLCRFSNHNRGVLPFDIQNILISQERYLTGDLDWDDVVTYPQCSGCAERPGLPVASDGPEELGEGSPETSREEANAMANPRLCELELQ